MKRKYFNRLLAMLLAVITTVGLFAVPASAATLVDSGTVTVEHIGRGSYLSKSTGGTIGGGYWLYHSKDGQTGTAYCVDYGLKGVSPSKALSVQTYERNPKTMGAFANGYPMCTLEQFKELHAGEVRGLANLTEDEYQYATQVAVWSTCGQLSVPGTTFTAGRASVVVPTSDAQQIRIFDSVKAILRLADSWTKHLYVGMYLRAEKDQDVRGVDVRNEYGLEGAAEDGKTGIKLEEINGREYYTRIMYVASATSTWVDGYKTKISSADAPSGTIFVAENNAPLETVVENRVTCYKVDTSANRPVGFNANGMEYYGAFKVCIPVDNVADEGSFTIKATGSVAQYKLYLAYNPTTSEQSYIIADTPYAELAALTTFQWHSIDDVPIVASLRIVKVGAGGMPLQGAKFTLSGSGGTVVTGTTDRNGRVTWTDLPADERYTLTETHAPEGYQLAAPVNVTLTAGRTTYLTVRDSTEKTLKIRKVDAQNGAVLQGAVFRFEQIDGTYKTSGTTGFDGTVSFEGDELPYGSYRVWEQSAPRGYQKDTRVETVHWDGARDITLTFENVRDIGLTIVKIDEQTGVSLPDATFDVYADGKLLTSVTTNDVGEAYVTGIKKEAYIEVVETAAPAGYVLDRTPHGIHLDPYDPATEDDPVLIVTNKAKPALRILKYDRTSGRAMPDVTFEVWHDGDLLGTHSTDGGGEIFLYDLEPGTFLVKEIATDDAHVVNSTPQQIELRAGDTQTRELVFFNSLKPGIHLVKVDSATMRSLPNVRFEFKLVGGSYRQELTTDINGEIDLSKLTPGAYEVQELEAPEGYLIDDGVRVVQINPDENASFVFTNTPKPALRLIKISSDGSRLAGVHFKIAKIEDGSRYLDRTTDSSGEINIPDLKPGVYSVQETATVEGHILDPLEYHVELFPGQTSTLTLENQKRPNLIVYKLDADTGDPIPGTVFTVRAADGHSVDEIRTDSEGKATLLNLLPGVYEVSEKSVPAPWLMDAPSQLVTLYPNRDHTVYFENHKKPALVVNKVDSITGGPIEGVKFKVTYASSAGTDETEDLGTFYTDENGQFSIDDLRDGWYRVTELEPASGYAIRGPAMQEVYMKGGESKALTFENTPLSALVVWKYDSVTGAAVEGAVFQVRQLSGVSGTGGTVIGTYKTGANGSFTVTGLDAGAYVVEELAPDEGHVVDAAPQTVHISGEQQDVVQLYFGNSPKGSLTVKKIDAVSHAPLSDVEFKVTLTDGSYVGSANGKFTTDSSGSFTIDGLAPGTTLVVKETRAKDGYLLDDTAQTVTITKGQAAVLEFHNQPKGSLVILKKDSVTGQALEGVTFKVTLSNGEFVPNADGKVSSGGLYQTDREGKITITGVSGTLVVTEVQTLPNYIIAPNTQTQTVVVNPNDNQTLTFYNTPKTTLHIYKYIEGTKNQPLAGVTFQITDSSGQVLGPDNGQYVTDKDGRIVVTGLTPGTTVKVQEVKTVSGFLLDGTPQSILIKEGAVQSLTFWNRPIGGIEIIKVNAANKSERIPNVTFEIRRTDDALIDTITTDKRGRAYLELEDGAYYALEVDCPSSFKLDSTPVYFTIRDGGTVTKTVTNEPLGGIIIHKSDSTTGEGIYGVKFVLYDSAATPLKEVTTDQNGYVYLRGLAVDRDQRFLLRELEAAPGYELDKEYKTVYLAAGQTKTIEWKNTPITGQIQIYKYAAEANPTTGTPAGTPLQGAVYEISEARSGRVVDYITTDARGVAASKPLPLNRYKIREVTAPAYWQVDATVFDETLEYPGQIIKLSAYDKPAKLGVSITKRGNAEVLAGSQMRYDITVANTSNVPLESFFWHDRIPTDAARATTLTTGTYSARLNYRILYKTNCTAGYQVLASNLLTSNNYSFALNAIPMQAGEVVTDVYFDFGTVPVGFQSVAGPTLSVQVLATAVNGYQLVNRADVGGKYQGTWQTGRAGWVTVIRNLTPPTPLPKTGY